MQGRKTVDYIDRTLIYMAKILATRIKKRGNYNEARPCVGIHILDFTLLDTFPHFHNAFGIFSFDEPHILLSDKFNLHYIEIPKVDFSSSHFTLLEKWLYFIKNVGRKEDPMIEQIRKEVPEIDKAAQEYWKFLAKEYEKISREKWEYDRASAIYHARLEGEAKKQRELALNLKAEGFDPAKIARLTGLSLEDVAKV